MSPRKGKKNSGPPVQPQIIPFDDGGVKLIFPPHNDVVAALKECIPSRHRNFDPGTKAWFVDSTYGYMGIQILQSFFPDLVVAE